MLLNFSRGRASVDVSQAGMRRGIDETLAEPQITSGLENARGASVGSDRDIATTKPGTARTVALTCNGEKGRGAKTPLRTFQCKRYFAVESVFTSWSINSSQNPCGSVMKNMRVVEAMKTGALDGLVVCKPAALTRSIITSSSFAMNKKCAAPGS